MRSYALAIAASMLLAAIYVFQNVGEVTVRFFVLERVFPQGVWEVLLFSAGAVVMWFFSILASLEIRAKYRAQLKDRDKKITALTEEKNSILAAFGRAGSQAEETVSAEKQSAPSPDEPMPITPLETAAPAEETERVSG